MRADKAQMELQQVRLCGVVRGVGRLRATALGDEWEAGKMRAEGARCSQGAAHCFAPETHYLYPSDKVCTLAGRLSGLRAPDPLCSKLKG
jgi:hypothetical protein